MTYVVLLIRQHGRAWKLGTASAGMASVSSAGDVVWEVTLPRQLRAGVKLEAQAQCEACPSHDQPRISAYTL